MELSKETLKLLGDEVLNLIYMTCIEADEKRLDRNELFNAVTESVVFVNDEIDLNMVKTE